MGDRQAALRCLGRCMYWGVISERNILRCKDGLVTLRYRNAKSEGGGQPARRIWPGADIRWLLLQHVKPQGLTAHSELRLPAPQPPTGFALVAGTALAAICFR